MGAVRAVKVMGGVERQTVRWDRGEVVLFRYSATRSGEGEVLEGFVRCGVVGGGGGGVAPADRPRTRVSRLHNYHRNRMSDLSHVDRSGKARMVDISEKASSARMARASGSIRMKPETLQAIRQNLIAKGDVISVARIAGIQAAKRTADLIPLCHQIPLSDIQIDMDPDESLPGIRVSATVRTFAQTGVEMEAITAVSVSLVTLYDMAKGVDKGMEIRDISLAEKRGGKSGDWEREG